MALSGVASTCQTSANPAEILYTYTGGRSTLCSKHEDPQTHICRCQLRKAKVISTDWETLGVTRSCKSRLGAYPKGFRHFGKRLALKRPSSTSVIVAPCPERLEERLGKERSRASQDAQRRAFHSKPLTSVRTTKYMIEQ